MKIRLFHIIILWTVVISHGLSVASVLQDHNQIAYEMECSEKTDIEVEDVEEENVDYLESTLSLNHTSPESIASDIMETKSRLITPDEYDLPEPPPEV